MAPLWKRILCRKCLAGNYHWFWQRFCLCRLDVNESGWRGGVHDMWKKKEYINFGDKYSDIGKNDG